MKKLAWQLPASLILGIICGSLLAINRVAFTIAFGAIAYGFFRVAETQIDAENPNPAADTFNFSRHMAWLVVTNIGIITVAATVINLS